MLLFKKSHTVEALVDENEKLKLQLEKIQERGKLFEDAFFNGLDALLEIYFPKPKTKINNNDIRFQLYEENHTRINPGRLYGSFFDSLPAESNFKEVVPAEIDEVLKNMESSFSERLMEIIRERNLNEVEVYKKADLDRRLFSKIRGNENYRPTKDTAILLCMSMELSLEDTEDLLKRAGMALSTSNKTDLIATFFIRKKLYNIPLYKEVLFKYGILKDY